MNEIHVTIRGHVASEPRHVRFDDGNSVTSFRLASTSRRYDRERGEWVDRGTTYVSVNCRRAMAMNAAECVHKGNPVLVTGRLWERSWSANGRTGQTMEVEADSIGHDLAFGTTQFLRIRHERAEGPGYDRPVDRDGAERPVPDLSGFPVLTDPEPEEEPGDLLEEEYGTEDVEPLGGFARQRERVGV